MALNINQIFIDAFTNLFENVLWLVPIAFIVAIYLFIFRYEVAYDFNLTRRGSTKLRINSFLTIIIIIGITSTYLYVKEYFFLLSVIISFILTYFLYFIGFFDMIIEWLEDRYGR